MWVRIDDTFYNHRKILAAGDTAIGLYVRALSYACHHMTDGFVPAWFVAGKLKTAERLILHGMWERAEGGFRIHDYLKYNQSKEEVLARRAQDRSRKIPDGIQPENLKIPDGIQSGIRKDSLLLSTGELELSSQQRKANLERLAEMTRSLTEKVQ